MSDAARIQRRLEREKTARKSAENIAEKKTRQLFETNQELSQLSESIKQRSVELQDTLGYLSAIIDNMADGLLVVDTTDKVKLVNQSFLAMFGLKGKEILNQNSNSVFDHHLIELIRRSKFAKIGDNIQLDIEMPEKKTGRAVVSPIFSEAPDQNSGRTIIGVVIIIRDFTKEKEVDRVKTEFISNVSHELRTPLTSILGFTKIIKKKLDKTLLPSLQPADTPQVQKAVKQVKGNIDIIIAEGERLTNLINGVLDVAKMEAGKVDWHMAPISVSAVIERAAASTQSLFEGKEVKFVIEVEEGLQEIQADQDRIIQVLVNLISNASKFTDEGSVTCKAVRTDNEIIISVVDTGLGIAQEHLGQVFDKFKQVGDTLTDKPKGTGLGLPICKQIVEHHNGKIWAESASGEGSTFSFTLPVTEVPGSVAPPERQADMHALLRQLKGQVNSDTLSGDELKKTVLVVDDEPNIREYLRQELESAGYYVQEAENGLDAIAKAKKLMPDLVILDVMMPMMNGFDAAAVLKNDPQTMNIPIVILSIVEDLERGYRIGINRYLKKPIEVDLLLNEIAGLVSREGMKHKILLVNHDTQSIKSLTQTLISGGQNIVEACGEQQCFEKAATFRPDTIIVDASTTGYQEMEKTLRQEKGLENVSFILLGEGQDLSTLNFPAENPDILNKK